MSAAKPDSTTTLVNTLLRKAHEQSVQAPEPAPFWRDHGWRCEFYQAGGSPRLKVFNGEVCVHEELVQSKSKAEDRCQELKHAFAHGARGRRPNGG